MDSSVIDKWIYKKSVLRFCASLALFFTALPAFALQGKELFPGIMFLTGHDLKPLQTSFALPELPDPYVSFLKGSVVISGTAQYHLRFRSLGDLQRGGPYAIGWNEFFYSDGTPMEGDKLSAHSWDMKPALWSRDGVRLWDAAIDRKPPLMLWYGGHMRPADGAKVSSWPDDNYSRDVFVFRERSPGKWVSDADSIFSARGTWPRAKGNYLGHRYGHQIVMVPRASSNAKPRMVPAVFFEEVTEVRENGSPLVTKIFMDEMVSPYKAKGEPVELISPMNLANKKYFKSAVREDGSALVEGPLYFRFQFESEEWEGIGFSAGSFYGYYPSCFASRKVRDGLAGKPYQLDLNADGTDLHNAAGELNQILNMTGGPGRPAVLVTPQGKAIPSHERPGMLQVLVHGYHVDPKFRAMVYGLLKLTRSPEREALRFQVVPRPKFAKPIAHAIAPAASR